VLSGGKADYVQVAVDAFGNALGNSVVEEMKGAGSIPAKSVGDAGRGIRVSEQNLAAFSPDPLSLDDGGLPMAKLRANLALGGRNGPIYTSVQSDFSSNWDGGEQGERLSNERILVADNSGTIPPSVLKAMARMGGGPNAGSSSVAKGSFLYGVTQGRGDRSVMDMEPVSTSEKVGAVVHDGIIAVKDGLIEGPLMVADTIKLGFLTGKAVVTGRADVFDPWSDTGKFAKAGGTLGEFYRAPIDAVGQTVGNLVTGEFEAAGSGAAVLFGGMLGGRGQKLATLGLPKEVGLIFSDTIAASDKAALGKYGFKSESYVASIAEDGRRVYKNLEIDPGAPYFVDSSVNRSIRAKIENGSTNADLMRSGYAPIGADGKQINLHHLLGQETGPLVELTSSTHQKFSRQLHGLIEDGRSFRNDPILNKQYNDFRRDWWKSRVTDFE